MFQVFDAVFNKLYHLKLLFRIEYLVKYKLKTNHCLAMINAPWFYSETVS